MRFKDGHQALTALRKEAPKVTLPLTLLWMSHAKKQPHRWTRFASNGRIVGANCENYSSRAKARHNYITNNRPNLPVYVI